MAQYVDSFDLAPSAPVPQVTIPANPASQTNWVDAEVEVSVATYQAYQILYYGFTALFVIVGFDKFLRLLTTWDIYVAPGIASTFGMSTAAMSIVAGVVELVVAAAIALKPRIGSWMSMAWLILIAINLLMIPAHFEIVVITLGMATAAFAFTRLAAECN